jgi:recombinational DNA repair protein (RecF pathway)
MKKSVDNPNVLLCHLCGKRIDPNGEFVQCDDTSNVYCSQRCYNYDLLQIVKKIEPVFAELDNILEQQSSSIEQKMNLLEAINEITNFILSAYGVHWFLPEFYGNNKQAIYNMFKKFNATPLDLDQLASDLYSMKDFGACG